MVGTGKFRGMVRTICLTTALFLGAISVASPAAAQNVVDIIGGAAGAAGVPQIPAFLPDKYSVPETEPLPIDGVWMISTIGKRIRIESGRAFAIDPWLHLFVLKVQPDMVVMQNFRRTGTAGQFTADDLPLQGVATFQLQPNGNLKASVQSMFGPVPYELIRKEPAFPDALGAEIAAMTGGTYAPPPAAYPTPLPRFRHRHPPRHHPPQQHQVAATRWRIAGTLGSIPRPGISSAGTDRRVPLAKMFQPRPQSSFYSVGAGAQAMVLETGENIR